LEENRAWRLSRAPMMCSTESRASGRLIEGALVQLPRDN